MVVDLRGIEPRDGRVGEKPGEQVGARVGKLVQDQRCTGPLGVDREQPGAGRRFEHHVLGAKCSRGDRDQTKVQRRRELLERLTFFRPARVSRQQCCKSRHDGELGDDRPRAQRRREPAEKQDQRDLARVIGVLP